MCWVKQPDGTFKQSYDYYGQPASDYEFSGCQVLKHINTIVVVMYLVIMMLKCDLQKELLQCPLMIMVKE